MKTGRQSSAYLIPSVRLSVRILDYLRDGSGSATLTELCKALGVAKSSCRNVTHTLEQDGLLEHDPETRKFSLGTALMTYGAAVAGRHGIVTVARRYMHALVEQTHLTAILCQRFADGYILVDKVDSPDAILVTMQMGVPVHWRHGVLDRAFLAFMPEAEVDELLDRYGLEAFSHLQRSRTEFHALLQRVRETGYTGGIGKFIPGLNTVAAPIFDTHGNVTMMLALIGTTKILSPESIDWHGALLRRVADEIAMSAGVRPYLPARPDVSATAPVATGSPGG